MDHNKIIFGDEWEFVSERDTPTKAVMKLNQWRSTGYEIVFITVQWFGEEINYLIARRKK
jgi:hypothetical protein